VINFVIKQPGSYETWWRKRTEKISCNSSCQKWRNLNT